MTPEAAAARLMAAFRALSAGERSTAQGVAQMGGRGCLMTTRGSPSDLFWRELQGRGWAEEDPTVTETLPEPDAFAGWRLTQAGAARLPEFLTLAAVLTRKDT